MSDKTGISWTDSTWNPIRGCSRVSPGCVNCYAERVAMRFSRDGQPYAGLVRFRARNPGDDSPKPIGWSGAVRMIHEHLADPLRWRKPRRIFVNSMSDLFHESLSNERIAAVFGVMAAAPQHTFQVLTKRARRMREWFEWAGHDFALQQREIASAPHVFRAMLDAAYEELGKPQKPSLDAAWRGHEDDLWPLPNVWLGVSVENQAAADERIPELLATPAAVRFLSCEPLLGAVDVLRYLGPQSLGFSASGRGSIARGIDWVIAGCESGPGARDCDAGWLRALRYQCATPYSVPFFLKQAEESLDYSKAEGAGGFADDLNPDGTIDEPIMCGAGSRPKRRRPGGNRIVELPYLDGVQHAEFPR